MNHYIELRQNAEEGIDRTGSLEQRLPHIIMEIDSLILKAYDLPPRLERKLLDFFRGYPRPVPFPFPGYFPVDLKHCIPLYQYLEMDMKQASAGELLKRVEPIDSEVIHEFVLDLEERQT